jgi:hypothetical protein
MAAAIPIPFRSPIRRHRCRHRSIRLGREVTLRRHHPFLYRICRRRALRRRAACRDARARVDRLIHLKLAPIADVRGNGRETRRGISLRRRGILAKP